MLVQQSTTPWQDHLRMQIANRLAIIDATPALSQDRHLSQKTVLQALTQMIKANAPEILPHGERAASYALSLGTTLGLSGDELADLRYAALLHDIGKLTLPEKVLWKDGPLTADEYALVQCNPRAGASLLEPIAFLRIPATLIAHHHERWDGSGYPYGLRGEFIPLGSRILAVADTFDVLTSSESYGQCLSPESASRLLRVVAGSQLDPDLVEVFAEPAPALFAKISAAGSSGRD